MAKAQPGGIAREAIAVATTLALSGDCRGYDVGAIMEAVQEVENQRDSDENDQKQVH